MRRGTLVAAAMAVAAVFSTTACGAAAGPGTSTAAAAKAAPKVYTRYLALEGSATHLLYSTVRSAKNVVLPTTSSPRYVLDEKHRSTRVPTGWTASLLSDRPLLTRPAKVQGVASVRWQLPESHRTGSTALPTGGTVVGAAPGGWVASVKTGAASKDYSPVVRLVRSTISGTSTSLGVPYPDGAPFALEASDTGLLAFSFPGDGGDSRPDSTIKYMAWSAPGRWTTLFPLPGTTAKSVYDIQCDLSGSLASCSIEDPGESLIFQVSQPKRPAVVVAANTCSQAGTPLSASTVWTISYPSAGCRTGTLARYTLSGALQRSTRVYARFQQPVIALNRIVVASPTQRTLYTLTSIKGTPERLIGG